MQPNKNINNDLEHLAEMGYKSFPMAENDISELKQKIKARSGEASLAGSTFFTIVIALFLGITLFFVIYNSPVLYPSRYELLSEKAQHTIIRQIQLDTINFTGSPNIKEQPTDKFSEPLELDTSLNFGKAEQLSIINEILVESNSVNAEDLNLKYSPNAPYIYLHDLKIANYNGYYFKTPQRIVVHGNIEADKGSYENTDPTTEMPYREYFLHDVIKDAMRLFKEKKYTQCLSYLNLISEHSSNDVNCEFYMGMCYFYLQNYEASYAQLKLSSANKINVFEEETNYYLALSALKIKKDNEAKSILDKLVKNNGFYSKKAQEILNK